MSNRYTDKIKEFSKIFSFLLCNGHINVNYIHNIENRTSWYLPKKSVDECVLVYIRSGNCSYNINGDDITLAKGDVLLIGENTSFSAKQGDFVPSLFSAKINFHNNDSSMSTLFNNPFYLHHHPKIDSRFTNQFEKLYDTFISSSGELAHLALINSLVTQIFCLLWSDTQTSKKHYDTKINKAVVYIEKHPTSNISIKQLASISGYSLSYFSKKFRSQTGLSPKTYLYHSKMKHAKHLLWEYNYSVKEVAYIMGYSDPYIFSNQFKNYLGCSPSEINKT
jgi:YesN/AraC family two-component response regulator